MAKLPYTRAATAQIGMRAIIDRRCRERKTENQMQQSPRVGAMNHPVKYQGIRISVERDDLADGPLVAQENRQQNGNAETYRQTTHKTIRDLPVIGKFGENE